MLKTEAANSISTLSPYFSNNDVAPKGDYGKGQNKLKQTGAPSA